MGALATIDPPARRRRRRKTVLREGTDGRPVLVGVQEQVGAVSGILPGPFPHPIGSEPTPSVLDNPLEVPVRGQRVVSAEQVQLGNL